MPEIPLNDLQGRVITPLGQVSIHPRGAYEAEATYNRLDCVSYGGCSYLAMQNGLTGATPEESESWMLLAEKGGKGDPGGVTSVNGQTGAVEITAKGIGAQDTLTGTAGQIVGFDLNNRVGAMDLRERNLLKDSGTPITSAGYFIHEYFFGDSKPEEGELVTLVLKGSLGEGKSFSIYNSSASVHWGEPFSIGNGLYMLTREWRVATGSNTRIWIYNYPQSISAECTIEWVKMVRGNATSLDWLPAPEDKQNVPVAFSVTLPAANWGNYGQQTVTDARFLADEQYVYDVDVHGLCVPWDGITITEGQMVVKVDIVPTADVTVDVIREEVQNG